MAMSTHAFHHHLQNDPQKATEILISRAARKMLCFGATPTAISAFLYHLDFADPNGQFIASGAKKGLENAAGSLTSRFRIGKSASIIFQTTGRCHQPLSSV
jgi:phosphoribosylformylglycinamidine synthase